VERGDLSSVASFYWAEAVSAGAIVALSGDALQHALVRRLVAGEHVRLVNGKGSVAHGAVSSATKREVVVTVTEVDTVSRPPGLEIIVPVADRDRMLWAAEKCAELQVTAWRPVMFRRSHSVSPRGEGEKFREKVLARMCSALEQCGGAWLPELHAEMDLPAALKATASHETRVLQDASGPALTGIVSGGALTLAVGPEGGFESQERTSMLESGWQVASLGVTTLRFETAIISAAAVVRTGQRISRS
jgi:16S rRNA (uracil1498-N3)-methyltransferase